MSVTVKDIAIDLHLSQPTVSRILSGDPNQRVSTATRQRVLDAAKRMRYQPNAVARSLRRGKTDIIGIYTNHDYDARNDFYGTVLGVSQRFCEQNRLDLLIHSALHDRPVEDMYAKLRDGRIDGLLLHATSDDPLVGILQQSILPVVAIADTLPDLPSVAPDDREGILLSISYLWEKGYRQFAYLCPEHELPSIEQRRRTFEQELARRGVDSDQRTVMRIDWEDPKSALEPLINRDGCTAVCCWNDRTAYRLLNRCLAENIDVPSKIAIIGFDGFISSKAPARNLVTVACPWEDVVTSALTMLVTMINVPKGRTPQEPEQILLPVKLLNGDTA
jgi:DNA-binding LacI/PurR family transcriptional regulator